MKKSCGIYGDHHVAGRSCVEEVADAEALPGSANGLNRVLSAESGKSVSATLNPSKTGNKNLCGRICDLWLVRKVIDFFKDLFRSKQVVESGCGENCDNNCNQKIKMIVPVTASKHGRCDDLSVEADLPLKAMFGQVWDMTAKVPSVGNLQKIKASAKKVAARFDRLKDNIKLVNRSVDLDAGKMKIENLPGRLNGHVKTTETMKDYCLCCNRGGYDDCVKRRYDVAKEVLKDHRQQLVELEAVYGNYKRAIEEYERHYTPGDVPVSYDTAVGLLKVERVFKKDVSALVRGVCKSREFKKALDQHPNVLCSKPVRNEGARTLLKSVLWNRNDRKHTSLGMG